MVGECSVRNPKFLGMTMLWGWEETVKDQAGTEGFFKKLI